MTIISVMTRFVVVLEVMNLHPTIFFECHHYEEQRIQLFTDTREFHLLNVHLLLIGKDCLSDSDNSKLFLAVQDYIHSAGRFDC